MSVTIPTLVTDRLLLRSFQESDWDSYAEMVADPHVTQHLGTGKTQSRPEAWRGIASMLGHWLLRGYGMWAAEERRTGELIGRIGLYNPGGWPGLEIGWVLKQDAWGQGYATEGARVVLRYGFEQVGATELISLIRPQNKASIRVAEKIGEHYRDTIEIFGGDALVYAIDRDQWKETIA